MSTEFSLFTGICDLRYRVTLSVTERSSKFDLCIDAGAESLCLNDIPAEMLEALGHRLLEIASYSLEESIVDKYNIPYTTHANPLVLENKK